MRKNICSEAWIPYILCTLFISVITASTPVFSADLRSVAGEFQPALALDTQRIEKIIGYPGQVGGGVFKITVGRPGVKMDGIEITSRMGLKTWAAFGGTNERAYVAGDVAMTAKEVNAGIRALRSGGIDIVAVHNYMLGEEPPMVSGVAIMTDTDNTGEAAIAYYGDIQFKKKEE